MAGKPRPSTPNAIRFLPGGIVEITLTQGKVALIDARDLPKIAALRWHASPRHRRGARNEIWYAVTGGRGKPTRYMHSVIMECRGIDHINHDGLDNRRTNLRRASGQQNSANARLRKSAVPYRGVVRSGNRKRFIAQITVDYGVTNLGTFDTAEEAAHAYDKAARVAFGDYANLNFPPLAVAARK